jgi:hypothetical protein
VVPFPVRAGDVSALHKVETVCGVHPASCPMSTGHDRTVPSVVLYPFGRGVIEETERKKREEGDKLWEDQITNVP